MYKSTIDKTGILATLGCRLQKVTKMDNAEQIRQLTMIRDQDMILQRLKEIRRQLRYSDIRRELRVYDGGFCNKLVSMYPPLSAHQVLDDRNPCRIQCTGGKLTGRIVRAMLEFDRLTEALLTMVGDPVDRRWGFEWFDDNGRVLCSGDGEDVREQIRAAMFTKTGRLKSKRVLDS